MKKTTQLKQLIVSPELSYIMEAHNGLSSRIVQETGFKGIWASGLTLSASSGVRDNNELSWTQVLDILEFMSDTTSIPILLDGDTGYGNFNNMRRLIKKLEQRCIAGVCIEDKLFPKTNSFIEGYKQPLADIEEFCGKIKAAKDTQSDPDFVVVARVESFIAGWGLNETLKRAEAYRNAGADAILIHSKQSVPDEIEQFMKEWNRRHPIVIVPTKYPNTPVKSFEEWGVSLVIWANHNLRASITAMQELSRKLYETNSLKDVENNIATVAEIFRLQDTKELQEAEKHYLSKPADKVFNAVILAASQGDLQNTLNELPKALIKVNGRPIIEHQLNTLNNNGIKDITIIRGSDKESYKFPNICYIDNNSYKTTAELYSLALALDSITENTVISYGDILYKEHVLQELLKSEGDIILVSDTVIKPDSRSCDYIETTKGHKDTNNFFEDLIEFKSIDCTIDPKLASGEFIGLLKLNKRGSEVVKSAIKELQNRKDFNSLAVRDLLNLCASRCLMKVKFIYGSWIDVNTVKDFHKAGE